MQCYFFYFHSRKNKENLILKCKENLILKCKENLTLLPNRFIQCNGIFLSHPMRMSLNNYPVNSFG